MATWYRKIDGRMYGDKKFKRLSPILPSGQSLWCYLLTGPHTTGLPGLFNLGRRAASEALGWSPKDFDRCWDEINSLDMAKADWESRVVLIPNAIYYNRPDSPNVIRGWSSAYDAVPECKLRDEYYARALAFFTEIGPAHVDAFRETWNVPANPSPPQLPFSTEVENPVRQVVKIEPIQWEEVVIHLNHRTGQNFSTAPSVSHRRLIEGLVRHGYTLDQMIAVIDVKVGEWGQSERMFHNLRPKTLFRRSNFENYVGQIGAIKPKGEPEIETVQQQKRRRTDEATAELIREVAGETAAKSGTLDRLE